MTARDTLLGLLQQWTERVGANAQTPELLVAASDAELLRDLAEKIREVGTAKGWSTWASAFIHPDIEFVDTGMPSTETIVGELRRLDRIAVLREAADAITAVIEADRAYSPRRSNDRAALGAAREIVLNLIDKPRGTVAGPEREKDTSGGNQPADGESTATPDAAELLAHVTSFEIGWPGHFRRLLIHRSYAGGDRWWISDREGRRWDRELGFVYEGQHVDERNRTDTRFALAEAWPLAWRIAADETAARAIASTTETAHATDPEGPSQ